MGLSWLHQAIKDSIRIWVKPNFMFGISQTIQVVCIWATILRWDRHTSLGDFLSLYSVPGFEMSTLSCSTLETGWVSFLFTLLWPIQHFGVPGLHRGDFTPNISTVERPWICPWYSELCRVCKPKLKFTQFGKGLKVKPASWPLYPSGFPISLAFLASEYSLFSYQHINA